MKVHQFARGLWEHEPSLTLGCKRLRPLASKLSNTHTTTTTTVTTFDLKSFIKPQTASTKLGSSRYNNNKRDDPSSPQGQVEVETQIPGGTRWNPTEEQIGILELVYRGGMRTPNAQQIEQMTAQLSKYGKIEGKNVFYWFQNHKARERQKQKRNNLGLSHTPPSSNTFHTTKWGESVEKEEEDSPLKKCRSWAFEYMEDQSWSTWKEEEEHRTLELFPLHPEGR